jgi:CheY-like chemotaxis protein
MRSSAILRLMAQRLPKSRRSGRVLVVDDYVDGADLTAMILSAAGYLVRVAYGSREALGIAVSFMPEVAVLDISMPEMDGHQLAEALRALPGMTGCKMIAFSAQDGVSARDKSLAAGFLSHLRKPSPGDALLDAVDDALSSTDYEICSAPPSSSLEAGKTTPRGDDQWPT